MLNCQVSGTYLYGIVYASSMRFMGALMENNLTMTCGYKFVAANLSFVFSDQRERCFPQIGCRPLDQHRCMRMYEGAMLASVTSAAENEFIYSQAQNRFGAEDFVWIGLSRVQEGGSNWSEFCYDHFGGSLMWLMLVSLKYLENDFIPYSFSKLI